MIALYRKGELSESCWLRSQDRLDELLALAQSGDSLHSVNDAVASEPIGVLQTVREQRERKECKQL